MRVMSLLGPGELQHLRRAAPDTWIVRAASLQDVLRDLAERSGGAVVLDPTEFESGAIEELLLRASRASARLLLCGGVLDLGAHTLVTAVNGAHVEVMGTLEAGSAGLARTLIGLASPSIPTEVLRAVGPLLLRMPHRAAVNAVRLFTFVPLPESASSMSSYLRCHHTTLCSHHRSARICSPHRLLSVAGVARACHQAALGERDVSLVAAACGFKRPRRMAAALRSTLGTSYRKLLASGPPERVAERLSALIAG
jgi:AraC-like DNA-binding protein